MDKVSVLMLKAFKLGGHTYEAGALLEVEKEVADLLIAKEIAVAKTLDQYIEETEKAAAEKAKAEADAATKQETEIAEKASVTRVHDMLADDPRGGYKYFYEFALDVRRASAKGRAAPKRLAAWDAIAQKQQAQFRVPTSTMVEQDDEQGGYLVPTEFRAQLLESAKEQSIVRAQGALEIPMQTNRIVFPAINESTHVGSLYGGLTTYRPTEVGVKHPSKPAFGEIGLTLHKIIAFVNVSDDLLSDSPMSLEPVLINMMGFAIAFQEDADFMNGTGVNMSLGAANAANPSLITVARNVAGQVNYQDIVRMWARLWPNARKRAVWMCASDVLPELMQMTYPGGATPYPVWMPGNNVATSPFGTIMGRPLLDTEKLPMLGVQGDIFLVDWSQYLIGQKAAGGMPKIDSSIHLHFDYDAVAFRAVQRVDGQPWWLSDITPYNGGPTYSPFVVLSDAEVLTTTTSGTTTATTTTTVAPTTTV